jgi:amino acid adenylation domain-containing protein
VTSICARIASHAALAPDHPAIIDGEAVLSYAALDRRANGLAAILRDAGAAAEVCVALRLDRSADFVVAALAVLKTGAAYVPIDATMAVERARVILADARAPLLLTHRGKTELSADVRTIEIDRLPVEARASSFPNADPDPASLAYVIYTSGSTGAPNGVEITHGNVTNLIDWHQSAFHVTAADRASQVAGIGFDAAVWEIWPHLTAGATVCLVDEASRRSPQALREWLVRQRITIAFVPTVLAEQMLDIDWPAETALRVLLTGADTLHRRPVAGLPFAVVNNYGPTECTVVSTSGVVVPDAHALSLPSIGRPITNATALVLDDLGQPAPPGEPGELCIAGALVGRGYRNNPQLTASRFATYSSASDHPRRIYRTGDQVRLLPTGELVFLGRLDDQVKIRGYRIELGEIVAHLNRCPGVATSAASVVAAAEDGTEPAIVAYVVARPGLQLTAADLRAWLSDRVPEYMMPADFVPLNSLPMTPNGKLDRASLPAPTSDTALRARGPATAGDGHVALQDRMAALVASLLDRPSVSLDENFFLLGGHSMLAAQLVARIRDLFGVPLTLRQLFKAPTVRAITAEVARLSDQPAHAASTEPPA